MNRALPLLAMLFTTAATASTPDINALKGKGGAAVLEAVEKRTYDHPTQKWTFKMTIADKGGSSRHVKFSVWQKREKRLVRFLEPGDVKGMSVLSTGSGDMYVYSPQTDNVRRVATSARRQTLLGGDMTYDDMASIALTPVYDVGLGEDTATHLWLELTAKSGADVAWPKLRIRIDKKAALMDVVEYWDGKKVREQSRSGFSDSWGAPVHRLVTMKDVATGHATTLEMLDQKIGEPIADDVFSKRSLVRGN